MDWILLAKHLAPIIARAADRITRELAANGTQPGQPPNVMEIQQCADCGREPWVVRWGNIRICQQLDGYVSMASLDGPILLCSDCWSNRINGPVE